MQLIPSTTRRYQSPNAQPTCVGSCTFASKSGIRNNKILCSFLLYTIVFGLSREFWGTHRATAFTSYGKFLFIELSFHCTVILSEACQHAVEGSDFGFVYRQGEIHTICFKIKKRRIAADGCSPIVVFLISKQCKAARLI